MKRKLKLLYATTYLPPRVGGLERVAWEIAKRFSEKGHTVDIVSTGKYGTATVDGMRIYTVPFVYGLTFVYGKLFKRYLNRLLPLEKYDILHVHNPLPWGFALSDHAKKMIVTSHGSDVWPVKAYPEKKFIIDTYGRAAAVTVASNFMKDYLCRHYSCNPLIIRNGIDTKLYCPGGERDKNFILFAGRYIEKKGVREVVKAAESLLQYRFYFAGDGPLKRIIAGKNITNLGKTDQKTLISYYQKATISVFPSHMENNPMVGLESMACGLPSVVTPCGFTEFLENEKTALVVPARDPIALRNGIARLMENPLLRKKLSRNLLASAKKHSWDAIINEYEALYRKVLL